MWKAQWLASGQKGMNCYDIIDMVDPGVNLSPVCQIFLSYQLFQQLIE